MNLRLGQYRRCSQDRTSRIWSAKVRYQINVEGFILQAMRIKYAEDQDEPKDARTTKTSPWLLMQWLMMMDANQSVKWHLRVEQVHHLCIESSGTIWNFNTKNSKNLKLTFRPTASQTVIPFFTPSYDTEVRIMWDEVGTNLFKTGFQILKIETKNF